MDTWLNNYNSQDLTAYFAISEKDWSNENIRMQIILIKKLLF
jgi:hypothetical protein